jgi:hypothetical protein
MSTTEEGYAIKAADGKLFFFDASRKECVGGLIEYDALCRVFAEGQLPAAEGYKVVKARRTIEEIVE